MGPVEPGREILQAPNSPHHAAEPSAVLICKMHKKVLPAALHKTVLLQMDLKDQAFFLIDREEKKEEIKSISCNCYNDCSVTWDLRNAMFIHIHFKEHVQLRDWWCGDKNATGATYKSEGCCLEIMGFGLKTWSSLGKHQILRSFYYWVD